MYFTVRFLKMCMVINKELLVKSKYNTDDNPAIEYVSQLNIIHISPFLDREFVNMYNQDPSEEVKYVIGIMMSLAAIYYFVYEIIKKVLG